MKSGVSVNTDSVIKDFSAYSIRAENYIDRALLESATVIETDAASMVPVDKGNLRNSIKSGLFKDEEHIHYGKVWTDATYAAYQEFGTGEFAQAGNGRQGGWVYKDEKGAFHFTLGNKPQPFMTPAFEKNKTANEQRIANAVRKAENAKS